MIHTTDYDEQVKITEIFEPVEEFFSSHFHRYIDWRRAIYEIPYMIPENVMNYLNNSVLDELTYGHLVFKKTDGVWGIFPRELGR
jgi:hypothetical protein